MGEKKESNGGVHARIGVKFHKEVEKIKDARLRNGKSKERVSTEKITNMIVKHKDSWKVIFDDIINADEEEVMDYGIE